MTYYLQDVVVRRKAVHAAGRGSYTSLETDDPVVIPDASSWGHHDLDSGSHYAVAGVAEHEGRHGPDWVSTSASEDYMEHLGEHPCKGHWKLAGPSSGRPFRFVGSQIVALQGSVSYATEVHRKAALVVPWPAVRGGPWGTAGKP